MSATPNQSNLEAAICKLHSFCSSHSLLKSDEELGATFESMFSPGHIVGGDHRCEQFAALNEVLPILHELAEELRAQNEANQLSNANPDNQLFASVKRHPE